MKARGSILVLTSLTLCALLIPGSYARGGGGGHGGFGGGFGGGRGFSEGDRGYGDRGYGDRGYGDRGYGDGGRGLGDDRNFGDHSDVLDHTSESALREGANRTYDDGGQRSLPSDGGFGRALNSGYGSGSGWGHTTSPVSPAQLANRGSAVRNAFRYNDAFRGNWWRDHSGAWYGRDWPADWAWGGYGWGDLAGYWDYPVDQEPVDYDYGNNITYQDDTVYYGSTPAASSAEYYQQALQLAQSVPPTTVQPASGGNMKAAAALAAKPVSASYKDFKPLGVYSMTQGDQTDSAILFQLAVDKKGAIRGNYYNALTQETKPVSGAVDKKNMRAAWTVAGSKGVVYDSGLSNLLHAQSPMLVHYGKDRTEQWNLVRMSQPKAG